MAERHPSRTILLFPEPGRAGRIDVDASRCAASRCAGAAARSCSEVIELRLRGSARGAGVASSCRCSISDLPVFCAGAASRRSERPRARAARRRARPAGRRLVRVARAAAALRASSPGSSTASPSRTSRGARSLGWRVRLAQLWPDDRRGRASSRVDGPRADALLLAGWLRSRLRREGRADRTAGERARARAGRRRGGADRRRAVPPSASDLLSDELDVFGRDPVYEAAVKAA